MQGPSYQPMPAPYPSHQQQPLFIIIPSVSGKHKPRVVPAYGQRRRSAFFGGLSSSGNKLLARIMPSSALAQDDDIIPLMTNSLDSGTGSYGSSTPPPKSADISIVVPAVTGNSEFEEALDSTRVSPSKRRKPINDQKRQRAESSDRNHKVELGNSYLP